MHFHLRAAVHFDVGSMENALSFVGSRANIWDTDSISVLF